MLKVMRESFHKLKWILLAVVAAFVFGFVFIDMGLGGAGGAKGNDRGYAARVNGVTISFRDYDRALYYAEENYKRMYGGQLTPEMMQSMGLPRQVVDALVDQQLILQEAKRLHLEASPAEVRRKIMEIPVLNPDGKFVGQEYYIRFINSQGYQTAAEFEQQLATEITIAKMEAALTNSVVISPKVAQAEYRRAAENAKIRYVMYPASREINSVNVTPADVEAFYRTNQPRYAHGEQRQLRYLIADYARLRSQISPSDAELQKRYDASKEDFKSPEAAHILHILIKVDPSAPPEVDAAARAKAQSLVAQLRAGADFAALAKNNSADPSSAANGGDMGFVERGQTVEAFDRAAFSIPLNLVSDPIRTPEYGYHIIKVLERRQAGYRPFEQMKAQLAAQVSDQMAKDQAREEMSRIASRIRQKKPASPAEFSALANDKVSSNETTWFQKSEAIPGLGFNDPLAGWAFSAKQGDVGEMTGTQRGIVIPYVAGGRPAGVTALSEIRQRVEGDARLEKARAAARDTLAKAMAGAGSVDAVAAKVGLSAADTTVSQQAGAAGIQGDTTQLVQGAMSSNVGQVKGPILAGDGAVVFQVLEQKTVSPQELAQNASGYTNMLREQQARSLRAVLLQKLRKSAKVDVNTELLQNRGAQPERS